MTTIVQPDTQVNVRAPARDFNRPYSNLAKPLADASAIIVEGFAPKAQEANVSGMVSMASEQYTQHIQSLVESGELTPQAIHNLNRSSKLQFIQSMAASGVEPKDMNSALTTLQHVMDNQDAVVAVHLGGKVLYTDRNGKVVGRANNPDIYAEISSYEALQSLDPMIKNYIVQQGEESRYIDHIGRNMTRSHATNSYLASVRLDIEAQDLERKDQKFVTDDIFSLVMSDFNRESMLHREVLVEMVQKGEITPTAAAAKYRDYIAGYRDTNENLLNLIGTNHIYQGQFDNYAAQHQFGEEFFRALGTDIDALTIEQQRLRLQNDIFNWSIELNMPIDLRTAGQIAQLFGDAPVDFYIFKKLSESQLGFGNHVPQLMSLITSQNSYVRDRVTPVMTMMQDQAKANLVLEDSDAPERDQISRVISTWVDSVDAVLANAAHESRIGPTDLVHMYTTMIETPFWKSGIISDEVKTRLTNDYQRLTAYMKLNAPGAPKATPQTRGWFRR